MTTWDLVAAAAGQRRRDGHGASRRCSTFILAGVDDDEVGSASGALNALQQLGGALGVAALGTLFFSAAAQAHGFASSPSTRTLWIECGVLVATAALVFLLPMRARKKFLRSQLSVRTRQDH